MLRDIAPIYVRDLPPSERRVSTSVPHAAYVPPAGYAVVGSSIRYMSEKCTESRMSDAKEMSTQKKKKRKKKVCV